MTWIPVISLPVLGTWDFSPLWAVVNAAMLLLPGEAYAAILGMWAVIWGARFAVLPIRWLMAWLGR